MQQKHQAVQLFMPSQTLVPGFQTALLTTYRRNGDAVGTPVGIINTAGTVYFATRSSTGKVKRLRHTPRVTIAPCRRDGRPTGPGIDATTRRLEGTEAAPVERLFFGSIWGKLWLTFYRFRRPHDRWVMYAVTPVGDTETSSLAS